MKKLLLLFLFIGQFVHASTYKVGATRTYISPNALYLANVLQDGDIIEIDAETYTGTAALAIWKKNNLIIKGVGGRPHLEADGHYIDNKGIWVLKGNNITVKNIEFSGATVPDQNGAGIRLDGIGMTLNHCYFHDNEDGILTSNPNAGDILIEYSEFAYNGYGDGQSHNLYVGHVNSLIFRYNYSHHAVIGQLLKSRAKENYILYNRIMDEGTGNSSRIIDLPNGGFALIMGNLLMQGPNAENNNLIGFGQEGLTNPTDNDLLIINNTLVNKRQASCIFIFVQSGTNSAIIQNNIFAGSGTVLSGTATTMNHNMVETNINNVQLVNESNYNYKLEVGSPAIDAGIAVAPFAGNSLTPDKQYVHPTNKETRPIDATIDIGAYEYGAISSTGDTTATACSQFTWYGTTYNLSNDYTHVLTDGNGDDSTVTLHLTINTTNINVTQSGNTLTSDAAGATYRWLDCNDGYNLISSETNQTFIASVNGSYAVEVTQNNCTDTSTCFEVTTVGIKSLNPSSYRMYPNPIVNDLIIESQGNINQIEVYNLTGQLLQTESPESTLFIKIDFSAYQEGMYLIRIHTTDGQVANSRIIKE